MKSDYSRKKYALKIQPNHWIFCAFWMVIFIVIGSCGNRNASHEMVNLPDIQKNQGELFIPYLRQQISRHPDEPSNYLKLARIYINQNKTAEARMLLQTAFSYTDENLEILAELSRIALDERDTSSLRTNLSRLRKLGPDFDETLILSAEYGLLTRQPDNAIYYANRAILKNPYNDHCRLLLGKAYLLKKDSVNALQNYTLAFSMNSSYQNFSNLFTLSMAMGQTDQSRLLISEYEAEGTLRKPHLERANFYNTIGVADSARIALEKCRIELPLDKRSLLEWARYYHASQSDSALQSLNLYLLSFPDDVGAQIMKARMKAETGETQEAMDIYSALLQSDSTLTIARSELDILERKVAYLRLVKRKDESQKQLEVIKPLDTKRIN